MSTPESAAPAAPSHHDLVPPAPLLHLPRGPRLSALHGVPGLLLAVGHGGRIERSRDGLHFERVPAPEVDLHAVHVLSPADAYVAGAGGTLLHYDGRKGTLQPVETGTSRPLLSVLCRGPHEVFAGGAGQFLHSHRLRLRQVPVPLWVRAIFGAARPEGEDPEDDELLLLGSGRRALHRTGGALCPIEIADPEESAPTGNLYALSGTDRDDVWAAGSGGALLHGSARRWHRADSGTSSVLTGLCMGPCGDPFVVTGAGQLRRLVDRTTWTIAAELPLSGWPVALCTVGEAVYVCTDRAVYRWTER